LNDPPQFELREVPVPKPDRRQVRVEVHAAACNFADSLMAAGRYQQQPALPFVPGCEFAGVVVARGAEASEIEVGQSVIGMVSHGAYAEQLVAPVELVRPLPNGVDLESAAALPISYGTAYAALVLRAALRPGETLLVHAAAGGAGRAAVEVGKWLGARVLASAGGPDKVAEALRAGADLALDYRREAWRERVLAETGGRGADVIFDPVGGDTLDESLRCIAWNGRLITVGFSSGRIPEIRANRILLKNISIVGIHWSAYPERDPAALRQVLDALIAAHTKGALRPLVSARYPLAQLTEAIAALADGRTMGKILILPRAAA
jgi:NADPH:quinone reductase